METKQAVVFKLKGHDFGIDIKRVIEIINYQDIRPVPEVPDYVEGIINVRGIVYPIFNLRKRLSMPVAEDKAGAKIILLHLDDNKVGFLVDSVVEILNIETIKAEQPPQMLDKKRTSCIDSIINLENSMVIILDVNALISDEDHLFVQGVSDEDDSSSNAEQGKSERN